MFLKILILLFLIFLLVIVFLVSNPKFLIKIFHFLNKSTIDSKEKKQKKISIEPKQTENDTDFSDYEEIDDQNDK